MKLNGLAVGLVFAVGLAMATAAQAEKARKATPPVDAKTYPLHETHELEKVTIAAEPCDVKEATPEFRLEYFAHGILPVRVVVTNDSDTAVTLDDARIHLIAADNTSLNAATDDEIDRRMSTLKGATGTKHNIPLGPIGIPITTGKTHVDTKITADDADFTFATTTVKPHTTVAGYLFL